MEREHELEAAEGCGCEAEHEEEHHDHDKHSGHPGPTGHPGHHPPGGPTPPEHHDEHAGHPGPAGHPGHHPPKHHAHHDDYTYAGKFKYRPYLHQMYAILHDLAAVKLVGRKMMAQYGPIGGGIQSIQLDNFGAEDEAELDLIGTGRLTEITREGRFFVQLPILYKDFVIPWRDVNLTRECRIPLDLAPFEAAADTVLYAEDYLIFNGDMRYNQPGLLNVEGHHEIEVSGWEKGGEAFADVVKGLQILYAQRETGPFSLALHPDLYAALFRIYGNSGLLEMDHIAKQVTGGVYPTPVLPAGSGVLLASGRVGAAYPPGHGYPPPHGAPPHGHQHGHPPAPHVTGADKFDVVIGKPLTVKYRCHRDLNYEFRVYETVALRIKQPQAIVVFRPQ